MNDKDNNWSGREDSNLRPLPPEDGSPAGTRRFSVATERTDSAPDAVCSPLIPGGGSNRALDPCLTPPIPSDLARGRWLPWQIAADIEAAAEAIKLASNALSAIHRSALAEVEAIPGTEFVDPGMYRALIALSDKWQAIADQEEEV